MLVYQRVPNTDVDHSDARVFHQLLALSFSKSADSAILEEKKVGFIKRQASIPQVNITNALNTGRARLVISWSINPSNQW